MKEWMKHVKKIHKADETYEFLSIADQAKLINVIDRIIAYTKENELFGKLLSPVYAKKDATRFYIDYLENPDNQELLDLAYDNSKYAGMVDLPLRSTRQEHLPSELSNEFIAAFKEYESVDNDLIKFKVHINLPGDIIMTHYDSPCSVNYGIPFEKTYLEQSLLIFMDDWQYGQAFQIGSDMIKWKKYDGVKWNVKNSLHGGANFGFDDRITFIVIWVQEE